MKPATEPKSRPRPLAIPTMTSDQEELATTEQNDAVISRALRGSLLVLVAAAAVVGGVFYFNRTPPEPPAPDAQELTKAQRRKLPPVTLPRLRFTDITAAAGIDFVHVSGESDEKLLPETMGGGVACFDYDGDGDADILFINSHAWDDDGGDSTLALYANDGKGNFTNVSAGSGLEASMYGMGAAVGDYDNDGLPDVYVTGLHQNRLFHNSGDGTFADVTATTKAGGAEDAWSTSAGFFDCDNDGDLDLFVCNYVGWSREFDIGQNRTLDGKHRAYNRPDQFPGTYCYLFKNEGDGRFVDASKSAGIQVDSEKKRTPLAKSLGVCFADLDHDGYLEVIVANDTVQNFLFHNQGDGTFQEIGKLANIAFDTQMTARGAMGIDIGRFRNSPETGIAIGNFSTEMTALYVSQRDDLQFNDVAIANGIGPVTRNELTFGLFFFDPDLNGRLDLLAANGHLERDIAKVQSRQSYEQEPQLLWNAGPGFATEFVPLTEDTDRSEDFADRMADFVKPMVGRGAAYADIDGDGDQDIVIAGNGQAARLLRNDQRLKHHWLQVKLSGRTSNRFAIGARVEVQSADGTTLTQTVMPTRSYCSQVESVLTFGLGDTADINHVRITWPGGSEVTELEHVESDQRVELVE